MKALIRKSNDNLIMGFTDDASVAIFSKRVAYEEPNANPSGGEIPDENSKTCRLVEDIEAPAGVLINGAIIMACDEWRFNGVEFVKIEEGK